MTDIPALNGPMLAPASGGAAKQLVILAHGVGSDGDDLIGLAPYFQKALPDALFVSPNAPYPFDMAPQGHQWFSLQDASAPARLAGTQTAAPILDAFIDAKLAETGLAEDKLALIGFSQGTMMALHVGLRRAKALAGILGYSGMLVGPELLADSIQSRPPVLLVHGDADDVLPVEALGQAVAGLQAAGVFVKHHTCPGLGHGLDDDGIRLGMEFLGEIFGTDWKALD
ncbi:MAG: prolyl oligopeptidase family serine peptidase [Rhodospirillales bacterium]|nr:prolyl oligopeptidase family serine peptidase [Rhodospirillales bacterium]